MDVDSRKPLLVRTQKQKNELTQLFKKSKRIAFERFRERVRNRPEKKDNSSLYAGSPMYYYCDGCGHLVDKKPELWFSNPPDDLCDECKALESRGWLDGFKENLSPLENG